jgi:GTPase SAR1 family protein
MISREKKKKAADPKKTQNDNVYTAQLENALNTYTCIIDVHSMQGLHRGWRILGDDTYKKTREGRVMAFVGEYKSGKTFLMEKVIGRNTPHDKTMHTLGLGVILPKDPDMCKEDSDSSIEENQDDDDDGFGHVNIIPEEGENIEADKIVDFIVLDTEGTDLATPEYRMYDERARELFLRQVQLEIADKFVYVTSKFNQKSQWNIKKLVTQLSYKNEKAISDRNRLIIVHNLMDVDDEDTLKARINEIRNCYVSQNGKVDWKSMSQQVHVNDKRMEHVYYQTQLTYHIFLVRHPKETYLEDIRYKRNMAAVKTLNILLQQCNYNRKRFHICI